MNVLATTQSTILGAYQAQLTAIAEDVAIMPTDVEAGAIHYGDTSDERAFPNPMLEIAEKPGQETLVIPMTCGHSREKPGSIDTPATCSELRIVQCEMQHLLSSAMAKVSGGDSGSTPGHELSPPANEADRVFMPDFMNSLDAALFLGSGPRGINTKGTMVYLFGAAVHLLNMEKANAAAMLGELAINIARNIDADPELQRCYSQFVTNAWYRAASPLGNDPNADRVKINRGIWFEWETGYRNIGNALRRLSANLYLNMGMRKEAAEEMIRSAWHALNWHDTPDTARFQAVFALNSAASILGRTNRLGGELKTLVMEMEIKAKQSDQQLMQTKLAGKGRPTSRV